MVLSRSFGCRLCLIPAPFLSLLCCWHSSRSAAAVAVAADLISNFLGGLARDLTRAPARSPAPAPTQSWGGGTAELALFPSFLCSA